MGKAAWNVQRMEAMRAAGKSWADIGRAYGRTGAAARAAWARMRPGVTPPVQAPMPPPVEMPVKEPASQAEEGQDPTPGEVASDPIDPFSETARDASDGAPPETSSPVASRLGEDAARAYLPLLFGLVDAFAGAGAVWLLRRKLGDATTNELVLQARAIASLSETERAALEAALVQRIAAIELTPDEALLYTVLGIYSAKALAVMSIEAPKQLTLNVVT